jgi:hypothetical protein
MSLRIRGQFEPVHRFRERRPLHLGSALTAFGGVEAKRAELGQISIQRHFDVPDVIAFVLHTVRSEDVHHRYELRAGKQAPLRLRRFTVAGQDLSDERGAGVESGAGVAHRREVGPSDELDHRTGNEDVSEQRNNDEQVDHG